jgi:hypothetical protein
VAAQERYWGCLSVLRSGAVSCDDDDDDYDIQQPRLASHPVVERYRRLRRAIKSKDKSHYEKGPLLITVLVCIAYEAQLRSLRYRRLRPAMLPTPGVHLTELHADSTTPSP